jgi:hypothetical protein
MTLKGGGLFTLFPVTLTDRLRRRHRRTALQRPLSAT